MGTSARSHITPTTGEGIFESVSKLRKAKKRQAEDIDKDNTDTLSIEGQAATWGILKILGL